MVLSLERPSNERLLYPAGFDVQAGDRLVISTVPDALGRLHDLNAAAGGYDGARFAPVGLFLTRRAGYWYLVYDDIIILTQMSSYRYHSAMGTTRKVQVTLAPAQYDALEAIARGSGRKLAAVVRESIVRYCLEPEDRKRRRAALDALKAADAPPPDDYAAWEQDYVRLKRGTVAVWTEDDD